MDFIASFVFEDECEVTVQHREESVASTTIAFENHLEGGSIRFQTECPAEIGEIIEGCVKVEEAYFTGVTHGHTFISAAPS